MDKVNKQELARLIRSLEAFAQVAKPESQWMPRTVFALLDELEQYRKDALRYRWLCDQPCFQLWLGEVCRDEQVSSVEPAAEIDALMAKEGGANG